MGRRGPKAKPAALKLLQGNPGHVTNLASAVLAESDIARDDLHSREPLAPPDFLIDERERAIFKRVVDYYIQRRIAHLVDTTAYGRWAHYVHRWLTCKELLQGKLTFLKVVSAYGERYVRNPVFKDMLDIERVLLAMEDRLGLNPVARQNIVRGLAAMPAALGGLSADDSGDSAGAIEDAVPSPIGIGRMH